MSDNDKILERIRNLLSLAEDASDDEGQTALLMAQKLMLKYRVSQDDIDSRTRSPKIVTKSLSVYKRIYWWEKILVGIVAENFRVMFYVQSNKFPHQSSIQRKLVLMGYPEDVELAYEIFHLAEEAMKYYANQYINKDESGNRSMSQLRKSYYQGFLNGLKDKFDKQRHEFSQENQIYSLVIQTPIDVQKKFNEEIKGSLAFKHPQIDEMNNAYYRGYDQGSTIELQTRYIEE